MACRWDCTCYREDAIDATVAAVACPKAWRTRIDHYAYATNGSISTQVPTVAWAQFVVFCGAIEANKYNWAKGEGPMTDPSKPFFDPLGLYPTDAAGQEKMQLRELKNARVAMIGFAGLFVNHFMPGAVPGLGGFH